MGYCWKCGNKIDDDAAYCPKCGSPVAAPTGYQRPPSSHARGPLDSLIIAGVVVIAAVVLIIVALIIVGLIPAIGFGAPVIGSGNVQTQQKDFSDFTAVSVGSGFNVQVTQAATYNVSITTDANLQQYVEVYKTGSTLYIRLKPTMGFTTTSLKAQVSMPDLTNLQLSGGVVGTASSFNVTHDFTADLAGGSRLTMTGQAGNLTAICSGGSNLQLGDFQVTNARVDFTGGSQGTVNVSGKLDAVLSGGSRLSYIGNPTLGIIDKSGGSTISKVS